mmetsp:Transcript_34371/g.108301  ORF Transcript_34371/g.108301 Transcript_34371/m.108301 type:complete len:621 (+) Transcript_34371:404-2266(+)
MWQLCVPAPIHHESVGKWDADDVASAAFCSRRESRCSSKYYIRGLLRQMLIRIHVAPHTHTRTRATHAHSHTRKSVTQMFGPVALRFRPTNTASRWQVDPVLTAPNLNDSQHVLDLRVGVRAHHGEDVDEVRLDGLAGDHHLEDPDAGAALPLPVLGVRVHALEHVEGFCGVEEVAHAVAVVGDEVQQVQRVVGVLRLQVQLPGVARVAVHDVAAREPADEDVALLVILVLDEQQRLLGGLVVPARGERDAVVPVEVVVVVHVRLDAVQVDVHVVELLEQEEARGHALAAGDGVALGRRRAHELEVLLRVLQVLGRPAHLPDRGVDDALEDVLLRRRRLEVLDELPRLRDAVAVVVVVVAAHLAAAFEVVDYEVEPRLRDAVHEPRQLLQREVPLVEDDGVVRDEIVRREVVALVHEHLEHLIGRLAVVELVVVAGLEVDGEGRVREGLQVDGEDLQRHVVVVELVVAHGHVHVEREVLAVLQEQALVDVRGLLEVRPQVVDGGERQLVPVVVRGDFLVVAHELVLVVHLVRDVEEDAVAQVPVRPLEGLLLGALVHLHVVEAARLEEIHLLRELAGVRRDELLVAVERAVEVIEVEGAVARPHQVVLLLAGAALDVEVH